MFVGGGVFTIFVIVGGRSLLPGGGNGGGCGVNLPLPYVGAAAADSGVSASFWQFAPNWVLRRLIRSHTKNNGLSQIATRGISNAGLCFSNG